MSEAEGQLDLLALLPTREEQRPTPPRLTVSPARGYAAREGAFSEWRQRYGGFDSARVSHGWHVALCEATGPVTRCQVTVLTVNLGCRHTGRAGCQCVGGLSYRGACLHCPWEGPVREDQTQAVGNGLDHAHPGWRNGPTVQPLGHEPSPKQRRRWNEEVDRLYGDRPEGYPIITERTTPGTRAVPAAPPGVAMTWLRAPPTPSPSDPPDQNRTQHTQYVHTRIACVACYRENRPERGKTK